MAFTDKERWSRAVEQITTQSVIGAAANVPEDMKLSSVRVTFKARPKWNKQTGEVFADFDEPGTEDVTLDVLYEEDIKPSLD